MKRTAFLTDLENIDVQKFCQLIANLPINTQKTLGFKRFLIKDEERFQFINEERQNILKGAHFGVQINSRPFDLNLDKFGKLTTSQNLNDVTQSLYDQTRTMNIAQLITFLTSPLSVEELQNSLFSETKKHLFNYIHNNSQQVSDFGSIYDFYSKNESGIALKKQKQSDYQPPTPTQEQSVLMENYTYLNTTRGITKEILDKALKDGRIVFTENNEINFVFSDVLGNISNKILGHSRLFNHLDKTKTKGRGVRGGSDTENYGFTTLLNPHLQGAINTVIACEGEIDALSLGANRIYPNDLLSKKSLIVGQNGVGRIQFLNNVIKQTRPNSILYAYDMDTAGIKEILKRLQEETGQQNINSSILDVLSLNNKTPPSVSLLIPTVDGIPTGDINECLTKKGVVVDLQGLYNLAIREVDNSSDNSPHKSLYNRILNNLKRLADEALEQKTETKKEVKTDKREQNTPKNNYSNLEKITLLGMPNDIGVDYSKEELADFLLSRGQKTACFAVQDLGMMSESVQYLLTRGVNVMIAKSIKEGLFVVDRVENLLSGTFGDNAKYLNGTILNSFDKDFSEKWQYYFSKGENYSCLDENSFKAVAQNLNNLYPPNSDFIRPLSLKDVQCNTKTFKGAFRDRTGSDFEILKNLSDNLLERFFSINTDLSLGERGVLRERLDKELSVIKETGQAGMFLSVANLASLARGNEILTTAGRGSAVNSFCVYLLGITQIDPIRYDLPCEIFLNPERPTKSDIDFEIADTQREKFIQILEKQVKGENLELVKCRTKSQFRPRGTFETLFEEHYKNINPQRYRDILAEVKNIRNYNDQHNFLNEELDKDLSSNGMFANAELKENVLKNKVFFNSLISKEITNGTKLHPSAFYITQGEEGVFNLNGQKFSVNLADDRKLDILADKGVERRHAYNVGLNYSGILSQDVQHLMEHSIFDNVTQLNTPYAKKVLKNGLANADFEDLINITGLIRPSANKIISILPEGSRAKARLKEEGITSAFEWYCYNKKNPKNPIKLIDNPKTRGLVIFDENIVELMKLVYPALTDNVAFKTLRDWRKGIVSESVLNTDKSALRFLFNLTQLDGFKRGHAISNAQKIAGDLEVLVKDLREDLVREIDFKCDNPELGKMINQNIEILKSSDFISVRDFLKSVGTEGDPVLTEYLDLVATNGSSLRKLKLSSGGNFNGEFKALDFKEVAQQGANDNFYYNKNYNSFSPIYSEKNKGNIDIVIDYDKLFLKRMQGEYGNYLKVDIHTTDGNKITAFTNTDDTKRLQGLLQAGAINAINNSSSNSYSLTNSFTDKKTVLTLALELRGNRTYIKGLTTNPLNKEQTVSLEDKKRDFAVKYNSYSDIDVMQKKRQAQDFSI